MLKLTQIVLHYQLQSLLKVFYHINAVQMPKLVFMKFPKFSLKKLIYYANYFSNLVERIYMVFRFSGRPMATAQHYVTCSQVFQTAIFEIMSGQNFNFNKTIFEC